MSVVTLSRMPAEALMDNPFLQRLSSGPILADGGLASMLYAGGTDYQQCFEEMNLSQPDLVQGIHRGYIAAGAEIIETNTFGANRFKLAAHGLQKSVRDINYAGAKLARDAREMAGEAVFVAGSIGPSGLAPRARRSVGGGGPGAALGGGGGGGG